MWLKSLNCACMHHPSSMLFFHDTNKLSLERLMNNGPMPGVIYHAHMHTCTHAHMHTMHLAELDLAHTLYICCFHSKQVVQARKSMLFEALSLRSSHSVYRDYLTCPCLIIVTQETPAHTGVSKHAPAFSHLLSAPTLFMHFTTSNHSLASLPLSLGI